MYIKKFIILILLIIISLVACTPAETTPEVKASTILIFNPLGNLLLEYVTGFQEELTTQGYADVTYVTVDEPESYSPPALETVYTKALANSKFDIVLCITTLACTVAQSNTPEDVAIIFTGVTDPIAAGLVADFTDNEGNITGVASAARNASNEGRAFGWLMEINPEIDTVFIPHNPEDRAAGVRLSTAQSAAEELGVTIVVYEVATAEALDSVIENIPDETDAIITYSESLFTVPFMTQLSEEAVTRGIPHMSFSIVYGQTMSYSPDQVAIGRQAGTLASRILSGTAPSDLPIETPEFNLYINLPVADAAGITINEQVLRQAVVVREGQE